MASPMRFGTAVLLLGLMPSFGRADESYFPDLVFDNEDKEHNDFTVDWYTQHLKAMREASLWILSQGDRGATSYRFLYLPTFTRPLSVRISGTGETASLHVVQLDGKGGYKPGKIAYDRTVGLTAAQWADFQRYLIRIKFWNAPARPGLELDQGIGAGLTQDGTRMVFEGIQEGRYQVFDWQWEEAKDAVLTKLCMHILELSGLDLEYPYIPEFLFDDRGRERYTKILQAMKEPSLFQDAEIGEGAAYRFLWISSPARSVALRVERTGEEEDKTGPLPMLHLVEHIGTTSTRYDVSLSREQWGSVQRRLADIKFWSLPTMGKAGGPEDAPRLLVEGVHDNVYHVIERAVRPPSDLIKVFEWVMSLAGKDVRGTKGGLLVEP
jgi:hypothetical protein